MYIRVRRCTTRKLFIDYFPTGVVVVEFLNAEWILLVIWHDHDWYRKIEIEHHRMLVDNREYDDVNANDQRSNDIHESLRRKKQTNFEKRKYFRWLSVNIVSILLENQNDSVVLVVLNDPKNFNLKSQLKYNIRGTSVKLEATVWKRTIININLEIIVIIIFYYLE